jgi:hypothetical protein
MRAERYSNSKRASSSPDEPTRASNEIPSGAIGTIKSNFEGVIFRAKVDFAFIIFDTVSTREGGQKQNRSQNVHHKKFGQAGRRRGRLVWSGYICTKYI